MPEITPVCQGKKTLVSFIKKGISSLGIATAIKVESTTQGLQYFFFHSIIIKYTHLNKQQRFFTIEVSIFWGKHYKKARTFCYSVMTHSTGLTLD